MVRGLNGKVALVTGATGDIGKAISRRLLEEGCRVLVHGRSQKKAAQAANALMEETGGTCLPVSADLVDLDQIEVMFRKIQTELGTVDFLINNAAALGLNGPFLETVPSDWDYVFAVNVRATLFCTQLAVRLMPKTGGVVINISSNGARRGHRRRVVYDASKGAIEAASRSLALELAPRKIRVNVVVPGSIRTRRWNQLSEDIIDKRRRVIPLGREGLPEDIAGVVAFLCSEDASYITGDTITVDGGIMAQLRPNDDDV